MIDRRESMFENKAKLVVLGNAAVGKSSLLVRYIMNAYTDDYVPTL